VNAEPIEATVPDPSERHTELWTYGGVHPGVKRAKVAIWYDEGRKRLAFAPIPGTHPAPGCVYRVEVTRAGGKVTRHTDPVYEGPSDGDWYARCEAEALVGANEIAAASLERKMARDGGQLAELIAPLEEIAGGLNYAQREALVALVTRKIYRADRKARS
jgi:hypothetical protein